MRCMLTFIALDFIYRLSLSIVLFTGDRQLIRFQSGNGVQSYAKQPISGKPVRPIHAT